VELSGTVMTWPKSSRGYNESTAVMYGDSQDQFSCLFNLCVLPVLHILLDYRVTAQTPRSILKNYSATDLYVTQRGKNWMQSNCLQLNKGKTEITYFGSKERRPVPRPYKTPTQ